MLQPRVCTVFVIIVEKHSEYRYTVHLCQLFFKYFFLNPKNIQFPYIEIYQSGKKYFTIFCRVIKFFSFFSDRNEDNLEFKFGSQMMALNSLRPETMSIMQIGKTHFRVKSPNNN
jgi:hypothetical protein